MGQGLRNWYEMEKPEWGYHDVKFARSSLNKTVSKKLHLIFFKKKSGREWIMFLGCKLSQVMMRVIYLWQCVCKNCPDHMPSSLTRFSFLAKENSSKVYLASNKNITVFQICQVSGSHLLGNQCETLYHTGSHKAGPRSNLYILNVYPFLCVSI